MLLAATCAAVGFAGYCVYFDHKRRSHPDFKKNLKESEFCRSSSNNIKYNPIVLTLPFKFNACCFVELNILALEALAVVQ